MPATLYLIPTFLSEDHENMIPGYVTEIIHSLETFVVEDEKSARHFLKKAGHPKPLNDIQLFLLNEHTPFSEAVQLIKPLLAGKNIGLLSEAGCPAVADPGSDLVKAAHQNNIRVVPLIGGSSIILALMASGLNGQSFSFLGYLPRERNARIKSLKELEKNAHLKNQTQIFIEAPYRNQHVVEDILQNCDAETRLCIACEITGKNEFIRTKSIREWKKSIPDINKRPAIFLIGRS
ncbi:MAG: SAM-dependent methyltransferase [Bacteroidetes bacterium]|nr:SAM-dependent methyltransferase [Bacteroidota bacterium]